MSQTLELGQSGERLATDFLKSNGFLILELNWRTKFGEIDIISKKGDTVYFVEVKSRRSHDAGSPLEQVTRAKQRKMINSARFYLCTQKPDSIMINFSVLGIDYTHNPPLVEFIEDAFGE